MERVCLFAVGPGVYAQIDKKCVACMRQQTHARTQEHIGHATERRAAAPADSRSPPSIWLDRYITCKSIGFQSGWWLDAVSAGGRFRWRISRLFLAAGSVGLWAGQCAAGLSHAKTKPRLRFFNRHFARLHNRELKIRRSRRKFTHARTHTRTLVRSLLKIVFCSDPQG